MDEVFQEYLDRFVIVFIDDTLGYSEPRAEHVRYFKLMSQRLKERWLYAKFSKCQCCMNQQQL